VRKESEETVAFAGYQSNSRFRKTPEAAMLPAAQQRRQMQEAVFGITTGQRSPTRTADVSANSSFGVPQESVAQPHMLIKHKPC